MTNDRFENDLKSEELSEGVNALLLDEEMINLIQKEIGSFNIFDAIGQIDKEETHSNLIAFLLDPSANHNIGFEFFSLFVKALGIRNIEPLQFVDFQVYREFVLEGKDRVDILCVDESTKFLLAVENKIKAKQGSSQLYDYRVKLEQKYPDFNNHLLVFLTLYRENPLDKEWISIDYKEVLSIIRTISEEAKFRRNNELLLMLDHYVRTMERNFMTDGKLAKKANEFYKKHKIVFNYIDRRKKKKKEEFRDLIVELAKNNSEILVIREDKGHINFVPEKWQNIDAFKQMDEGKWKITKGEEKHYSKHSLRFEIKNYENSVSMTVVMGPIADKELRQEILEFCKKNPDIFLNTRDKLSVYTELYRDVYVKGDLLDGLTLDDAKHQYETKYKQFMDKDFARIVDALANKFQNWPT